MALPTIAIVGNTAGEPELRFTQDGKAVCSFRVVANKRKRDRDSGEWYDDGRSPFMNVSVFGPQGEALAEALSGQRSTQVIVSGQLRANEYETRDGQKRESVDIEFATVGIIPRHSQRPEGDHIGGAARGDKWASPTNPQPPF